MSNKKDPWIWIDPSLYPDRQTSRYTGTWGNDSENDTVVEFSKSLSFDKKIESVEIKYSADALAQLWVNDRFLGTGPVLQGGDFYGNDRPRKNRYFTTLSCIKGGEDNLFEKRLIVDDLDSGRLDFLARVRLFPIQICEFSMGRGGFMLIATVHFEDGDTLEVSTDSTWHAKLVPSYYSPKFYDGRLTSVDAGAPIKIEDIWCATDNPLPLRYEKRKLPLGDNVFSIPAGKTRELFVEYDKIYAGYLSIKCKSKGTVSLDCMILETNADTVGKMQKLIFSGDDDYLGSIMYSVGLIKVSAHNESCTEAVLDIAINEAYLPSCIEALTVTDRDWLNKVLSVSKHTLKYCRQYIHLDSPKHCEPSACAGDYFIETMMSSFSYADMTLADFDVVRIAAAITHNNGQMFHPTYSLIWVRMLLEVYKRNGRIGLLKECREALSMLLELFSGYIGDNGIIDTPPNFMFVDWIYIDDISLHHPPKALGQGVINMFYYDALNAAAEIFGYLGETERAAKLYADAQLLGVKINENLYDNDYGLYFEGLNTPTPKEYICNYMPVNTDKRYYRINSNALAVAFGVVKGDRARDIMRRVLSDKSFDDYQPYFAHFVLKAIHECGLDEEYLLKILEKWRVPIEECDKGLAEGFIPPEPTYVFDHSHAWGGTSLYSLPMALTSLEILEPGMSHLRISPKLTGLRYARVEIPTPRGCVTVEMKGGEEPRIIVPSGIKVDII